MELETPDEGLVQRRIDEDGQDIFEQDTRRREVGELAQGGSKPYLKTGEFGGAGGIGGGVSGDFGGVGIGDNRSRRVNRGLLGHDEEKEKKRGEEEQLKNKNKNIKI